MVTEVSSYTSLRQVHLLESGNVIGYRQALREWFWCSNQAEAWLGEGDIFRCGLKLALSTDVLPPSNVPGEYRKPVFITDARRGFFNGYTWFGQGELLKLLVRNSFEDTDDLRQSPHDNIFLLAEEKMAVVHWLPAYNRWQLHVTHDWQFIINPGTRLFVLQ